jgi:hypothetical protein
MWIDWKINKDLEIVRDELILEYLSFNQLPYKSTSSKYMKVSNVIGCLLNNFSYAVRVGNNFISIPLHKPTFSKSAIYNGIDTGRKVSYEYFISVLEWLNDAGYARILLGQVLTWKKNTTGTSSPVMPDQCSPSMLVFGEYLQGKVKDSQIDMTTIPIIPDVIQMRDENKSVIEKTLGREENRLLKILDSYNFSSRKFVITVGDNYFDIQLRKVFNNSSWNQGGRSYVTGEGSNIMKRSFRKDIRIDGNLTVEIDFKSLHPSMIAELQGYKLPDGFDPYGIYLDGYDSKILRSIAKIAFMCIFNSKNLNQATAAVSKELRDLRDDDGLLLTVQWKDKGLVPKVIQVKEILQLLAMHNIYAQDWVFSGKGIFLQNTDSKIMDCVIQQFLDVDEFMIPVHDSIIVEDRLKDFAVDAMQVAYKQVMKTDINCRLDIK